MKKSGKISFNTINLKLKSEYGILYTRFGVAGIKIIFCY